MKTITEKELQKLKKYCRSNKICLECRIGNELCERFATIILDYNITRNGYPHNWNRNDMKKVIKFIKEGE